MEKYFKNLKGKSRNVTDKPIMKIIHNKLDIKLKQFTQKELRVVITQIKTEKLPVSMKYPQK